MTYPTQDSRNMAMLLVMGTLKPQNGKTATFPFTPQRVKA